MIYVRNINTLIAIKIETIVMVNIFILKWY